MLQALFSLPSFVADLQALAPRLAKTGSSACVATEAEAAAKPGSNEKQQQLALPLNGVCAGLLQCLSAKDGLETGSADWAAAVSQAERNYIVPACLKAAVGARSATFVGTLQQDAHEFLCSLLAGVQEEVLAGDAARLGRRQVCHRFLLAPMGSWHAVTGLDVDVLVSPAHSSIVFPSSALLLQRWHCRCASVRPRTQWPVHLAWPLSMS